jgi:hypothetical protein
MPQFLPVISPAGSSTRSFKRSTKPGVCSREATSIICASLAVSKRPRRLGTSRRGKATGDGYDQSPLALNYSAQPEEAHDNIAGEAAIRTVTANALVKHGEISGRGLDALFAMRQVEAIAKALEYAGYEIKRRS